MINITNKNFNNMAKNSLGES